MLHTVQQRGEPRQRVFFHHINGLQAQLAQAPIGNIADIALNFLGGHAGHGAHFKRQINEAVFQTDNLLAAIDNVFLD